ncbi:sodium/potassium-transporting ATPase subunit beta-1 [Plakobranchus ocellatus]|uniref:Sodium/potassium-transporting ATPase subunit beta-1 n=1 Tax=Plakobranchus ocellatus TaxID=259542 RepID=A0AAV3ZGW5_9GAST|nr:sodium/potassium-transporting ATPase subunit beta-1 [Plakobranchus ocellatus]
MSANPYDPVTTTDSTHLADDDWGLSLPPIRYKNFSGTSRLKSVCLRIRQHPKCLGIILSTIGIIILLVVIISVASSGGSSDRKPTGNEPKWKKTDKGLQFYPVPEDGTIVLSFNPEKFYLSAQQPIEKQLNERLKPYLATSQMDSPYTECNATYSPPDKVCRIPSSLFGDECSKFKHYGYYGGQPCILIQLVLPDDVRIQPITKDSPLWNAQQADSGAKMSYDSNNVPITCHGKTEFDNLLLKPHAPFKHSFEYYPSRGFSAHVYRPRMASLPHVMPAVMVRLTSLLDRKLVHVTCTAWGQLYDFSDKLQSHKLLQTSFAVYIDH